MCEAINIKGMECCKAYFKKGALKMEGLKIFENVEFGKVRVVEVNGDP